jgi:hypothetical protein
MPPPLPLLILANSDRQAGPVPRGLRPEDMLRGFKGAHRLASGRCLAAELVERYRQSGRFADPILIGPRHVYQGEVDCEIVHVEGNLPETLNGLREVVLSRFDPASPVAFSTCDILPTPDEVRRLLETSYDPHADCVFWGQLVEARPQALGASAWKPGYRFVRERAEADLNLYPGHLVIARPAALRIRLTNHLLSLAYRYRNRDLRRRPWRMVASGLGRLLWADLRSLLMGRLPILTLSIPYHGLKGYYRFRRGKLTPREFEYRLAKTFLHRDFHRAAHGRPVVFAITSILSFAKDIDTVAELAEAGGQTVPVRNACPGQVNHGPPTTDY